ncbi:hypothetical protein CYMTET_53797 [Cymbomonas tetramitiformis]|uniref:Uncharacterized protein n=1 Tax=Cymbomonas tetramitiformis TaxID=36881 RepID=A0AAE0BI12_9CHLO|nr:hypothetical protein CYMTET_53797 [Cymbomonas tetramitiformis]
MILEHGFMNTEKGRMCYVNNLQQIRNAVLETVYLGVLEALLRCKSYDDMWNERFGGVRSSAAARKSLMMEVEDFATIQKTEHGWDMLDSRCKRFMRSKNVQPDTWIIPEGMKSYISQVRRENHTYMLAGPEGPQNFKSGLNGQPANVVDSRNDCNIFETKSFEMPEMSEPIDVTRRNRAIGEFFLMQEDEEAIGHRTKYMSSHRNIVIYDEDVDNFVEVRLLDAIEHDPLLEKNMYEVITDIPVTPGPSNDPGPSYSAMSNSTETSVEFGDIPPQDELELNSSRGPPMSDRTLTLFADTYFDANTSNNFMDAFGQSAPQYFIDMDNDVRTIGSETFEANVKRLFSSIITLQSHVDCNDEKESEYVSAIAQHVRELFAKKEDAYAFYMLAHGIASEESYFASMDTDKKLHSVYIRQLVRFNEDQELLPLPPQLSVQCFQQTCTAIFVTIIRQTINNTTALKEFDDIQEHIERLLADICGTWFEVAKEASYTSPNVESYRSMMDKKHANSLIENNRGVSDLVYKTLEATLFVGRALFQYMSTSQYLRRGEACDCRPVGFNTLDGARALAKVNENRIYQSDKCEKMVQMYLYMLRCAKTVFGDHGLTDKEADLFNLCIAKHQMPGNVYINMDKLNNQSATSENELHFFTALDETQFSLANSGHLLNISSRGIYFNHLPLKKLLESLTGDLGQYNTNRDISSNMVKQFDTDHEAMQFIHEVFTRYECVEVLHEIEQGNNDMGRSLKQAIIAMFYFYQKGCYKITQLMKIAVAYVLKWASMYMLYTPDYMMNNYQLYAPEIVDKAITHMDNNAEDMDDKDVIKHLFCPTRTYCVFKNKSTNAYMLSTGDGIVQLALTGKPENIGQNEQLARTNIAIRTAFKAPKKLSASSIFTRMNCDDVEPNQTVTKFILYLKSLRKNDYINRNSSDKLFDEWCNTRGNVEHGSSVEQQTVGLAGNPTFHAPTIDARGTVSFVSSRKYKRLSQAYETLRSRSHALMMYTLFCTQEVSKDFLRKVVKCDVMFPFGYLLLRPYQTYEMCTAILTKAGRETGETLIGHYDFQLSDNVIQKMHYGNFTIYLKSIVYRPNNVFLAEDIFCANYISGGGTEFVRATDNREDSHIFDHRTPSLYPCLIGYDEKIKDNPISVTGKFEPHTCLQSVSEPHYSTANTYKDDYSFYPTNAPSGDLPYFDSSNRGNTICFQGHQASYNHNTGHLDRVTLNTGHWGERVYPGCGKVRRGLSKYLEPVNYNTMRKGGGGAVTTGFGMML